MIRIFGFALILLLAARVVCSQDAPVSYLDGTAAIPDDMVRPSPADGSVAATNPPGFVWLPEAGAVSYTLECSRSTDFSDAVTLEGTKLSIHQPNEPLPQGTWHWRYRAVFADGKTSAWSITRSFRITRDSLPLRFPPFEEVKANVLSGRPRLFARAASLEKLRAARFTTLKALWEPLEKTIESSIGAKLIPEPERYPNDTRTAELWRKNYGEIRAMTGPMEYLAFGYLVTGERKYADEAKRIMLYLCSWDPNGTSRYTYDDEVAMPLANSVSRAYDWIHDTLTPEERTVVVSSMRIRMGELYQVLKRSPYEARPYSSHSSRALMFLGEASIAFMGEVPECEEWLEYVLKVYACVYPPWGGADGSYSEGPWYWASYIGKALSFNDALQGATGVELYGKPFFRHTGDWALYCVPPFLKMVAFGDGQWLPPGSGHQMNLYRLSSVYKNPYYRWYSESFEKGIWSSPTFYLWKDDSVKAKPPTDIPQSKAFYDSGEVAMHSNLADGLEDRFLLMRSSPGGSWSHSFADQNGFYLQAFGEPLAIPTGYRPFYGDAHHKGWTWETKAHNSILVDGQGQVTRSRSSQGRIAGFITTPRIDYTCGDATRAYGGRLDRFLRHVIFLRPNCFVMIDDLHAPKASTYQWLLHSVEKMDVDEQANRAVISKGDARLSATWVWPDKLDFSQTDQFSVAPANGMPNQWHLTASTTNASRSQQFVTVLHPYKANNASQPLIERIEVPGAIGVRLSQDGSTDTVVLNKLGGPIAGLPVKSDAHIVSVREEVGKVTCMLIQAGSYFTYREESVRSDAPVNLVMDQTKSMRSLVSQSEGPARIEIAVPEAASKPLSERILGKMSRSPVTDDMDDPKWFRGTVRVDGKGLSRTEFSFDRKTLVLSLKLPAGEHRIEIKATGQPT